MNECEGGCGFTIGNSGLEAQRREPAGRLPGRAERSGGNRPGTRRRHLIRLGIDPGGVHRASRSRKGYWRMSQNSLVRFALNNRYLKEQGVPELGEIWIRLHYGDQPKPKGTGKLVV